MRGQDVARALSGAALVCQLNQSKPPDDLLASSCSTKKRLARAFQAFRQSDGFNGKRMRTTGQNKKKEAFGANASGAQRRANGAKKSVFQLRGHLKNKKALKTINNQKNWRSVLLQTTKRGGQNSPKSPNN